MPKILKSVVRKVVTVGAFAVASALAHAQQVGSYVGATSDGHQVSIDVKYDTSTGHYAVTGISVELMLRCPRASTSYAGLGLGVPDTPVVNGSVTVQSVDVDFYLNTTMTFVDANTVTGRIQGGLPQFVVLDIPPRQAQVCKSETLGFTATYSPTPQAAPAAIKGSPQFTITRNGAGQVVKQSIAPGPQ